MVHYLLLIKCNCQALGRKLLTQEKTPNLFIKCMPHNKKHDIRFIVVSKVEGMQKDITNGDDTQKVKLSKGSGRKYNWNKRQDQKCQINKKAPT